MNTKENTTQLLAQLNQFTRRVHQEDEVFLFDVHLCDNEIDRDNERFPAATLEELADVLEVADALREARGWSREELDRVREEKAQEKGRFQTGAFLVRIREGQPEG